MLAGLWDDALGHYLSRDLIGGNLIPVRTSAGFLPIFAGLHEHVREVAGLLEGWRFRGIGLVPSTDP